VDKVVHLTATLKCGARRAFELFTTSSLLESWLTKAAEVEPVVGGKYELFWEPNDRENNSTIGCRVTAIQPEHFLSFEWRSPKQYKHFANNADPLTHVVVFFIPENGSTHVHLIHSGWRSTREWEEARQWQARAWGEAFKELEARVSQEKI
jgi:uncharacterized protein YndB with AHSA1/START domain